MIKPSKRALTLKYMPMAEKLAETAAKHKKYSASEFIYPATFAMTQAVDYLLDRYPTLECENPESIVRNQMEYKFRAMLPYAFTDYEWDLILQEVRN